jgi:hypothetical protein
LLEAEMARLTEVVQFSEAIQEAAATKGSLLRQCFQGSNLVLSSGSIFVISIDKRNRNELSLLRYQQLVSS